MAFALLAPLADARADEPSVPASIKGAAESRVSADLLDSDPATSQSSARPLILAPPNGQRDPTSGRQPDARTADSRLRRSGSWWTAGSLCIVLALFVVAAQLFRHRLPLATPSVPKEILEPLGRCQLDAKQSVHLVRCGSQILVLGSSGAGLRSLAAITDPKEVDRIAGQCRHARRPSAAEAFSSVFARQTRNESLEHPDGGPVRGQTRPRAVALEATGEAGEANHV